MRTIIYDKNAAVIDSDNPFPVTFGTDIQDSDGNLLTSSAQTTISTTITGGQSQSSEIDLESYGVVAIMMPAVFGATSITFLASATSGGTFYPVYDSAGNELAATVTGSHIITDLPELAPLRYIKIRSGTEATPLAVSSTTGLTLIVKS